MKKKIKSNSIEIKLNEIKNVLNIKKKIIPDTELATLVEWDSMGGLTIIAFANSKYKKIISGDDLFKCKTVQDIINLLS
jgi:acyl carrier protein